MCAKHEAGVSFERGAYPVSEGGGLSHDNEINGRNALPI